MLIDFNRARKKMVSNFTGLVEVMNKKVKGRMLVVPVDDIKDLMDDMRTAVVSIALTYEEGRSDFAEVLGDEVVPVFQDEDLEEEPERETYFGPNGPTGHGDDCLSDADPGL